MKHFRKSHDLFRQLTKSSAIQGKSTQKIYEHPKSSFDYLQNTEDLKRKPVSTKGIERRMQAKDARDEQRRRK